MDEPTRLDELEAANLVLSSALLALLQAAKNDRNVRARLEMLLGAAEGDLLHSGATEHKVATFQRLATACRESLPARKDE